MDSKLYRAAMEGNSGVVIQKNDLENQFTPNKNSVLHVAAQSGQIQCVMEILNINPSMCRKVNARGDTALHIASREGHTTIVQALIEYANALDEELDDGVGTAKDMMRVTNEEGDTALHDAVRNHHPIAVQLLTKEDPEFCHPANNDEETPLYLAAERGYVGLVLLILETCIEPAYGGPSGRTALHSAAIHNFEGCTNKLLEWKPALVKQADVYGWTPLHYAAYFGYVKIVNDVLNTDKSVAYIANKDSKRTALHLAASLGHVHVMKALISQCPDCWEMVDEDGQNILHIAARNKRKRVIKFILQNFSFSSIINQKDIDGNTPLRLLAASDCCETNLVMHAKSNRMDVCSNNIVQHLDFRKHSFRSAGDNSGRRVLFNRDKHETKINAQGKERISYFRRVIDSIRCTK